MRPRAESVGTLVIGAGQAGLAVGYYLTALGVEHLVLERGEVAESWRSARWDSFTLVTPNWMTRLPGYQPAPGTAARFDARDGVISTLERFAAGLPVQPNTEVRSLAAAEGGYRVTAFPGLYVTGYPWLSTRGSGIMYGVAADAERIAQHIAARRE